MELAAEPPEILFPEIANPNGMELISELREVE